MSLLHTQIKYTVKLWYYALECSEEKLNLSQNKTTQYRYGKIIWVVYNEKCSEVNLNLDLSKKLKFKSNVKY